MTDEKSNDGKQAEKAVPDHIEEKLQRVKKDEKLDEITERDNPSDRFPQHRRS